jgi:hypothetical protein
MSFIRSPRLRARAVQRTRARARRGRGALGATSYADLPDYCFPFSEDYYQLPGVPGTNGVPDYATALATCSAAPRTDCQAQADTDAGNFIAGAQQLQSWNPGGDDFTPQALSTVLDQIVRLKVSGIAPIIQAEGKIGTSDDARSAFKIFYDLMGDIQDQVANYQNGINIAKATGLRAIHAPGLKAWVVDVATKCAQAVHYGSLALCDQAWWSGFAEALIGILNVIVPVIKAVGAVILAAGEKAAAVVEGGLDLITIVEKYAPIAAVALAAWWIFIRETKGKKASLFPV